jgi:alanine dehydrogenase
MTLFLSNEDVARVLTMGDTIAAIETAYDEIATGDAVCRPRIDIRIPTGDPAKNYQWGSMEGGSTSGYFAIRMKSDVVFESEYHGVRTQEKYCLRPGLFCGLVFLTAIETGEPLAFINDGVLQHMRVGADGGIGVKYLANTDAASVGMLGSGGMAHSNLEAFMQVRKIRRLHVFSPTPEHRESFAREAAEKYGIETKACARSEEIYEGADIVAACTDSAIPVLDGTRLEPGAHVINIGGSGTPDAATLRRVDVYLRFGDAPAPASRPDLQLDDEHIGWEARSERPKYGDGRRDRKRGHGVLLRDRRVSLADLKNGRAAGRAARDQITYSERGNLQGAQFFAVAGLVYERAKAAGLGREIPTEWLMQDIRN